MRCKLGGGGAPWTAASQAGGAAGCGCSQTPTGLVLEVFPCLQLWPLRQHLAQHGPRGSPGTWLPRGPTRKEMIQTALLLTAEERRIERLNRLSLHWGVSSQKRENQAMRKGKGQRMRLGRVIPGVRTP